MKYSFVTVLSIAFNVLLTKGQNEIGENELTNNNNQLTKAISFDSILEDINDFYSQNHEGQPQIITNPNVKFQTAANDNSNKADSTSNKSEGDANKTTKTTTDSANTNTNGDSNNSGNNTGNNSAANSSANGNANNNTNNNTSNTTNSNANNDANKDNKDNQDGEKKEDDEEQKLIDKDNDGNDEEHNEGDGCEHNRDSLGMFAFVKPVKRSILVTNSNFTIQWFYNKILAGYTYNYPSSNITFKLFYEDDSNPNNWGLAWGNPVFERTVPISQIEDGPIISGSKTYQYNWEVITDTDHGFKQSPKSAEKYRLRIYGDDKDAQSNQAGFQCYSDGDISPGLTVPFYLVENQRITDKYYQVMEIEDDARMNAKVSLYITFIATILLVLYNNW